MQKNFDFSINQLSKKLWWKLLIIGVKLITRISYNKCKIDCIKYMLRYALTGNSNLIFS